VLTQPSLALFLFFLFFFFLFSAREARLRLPFLLFSAQ